MDPTILEKDDAARFSARVMTRFVRNRVVMNTLYDTIKRRQDSGAPSKPVLVSTPITIMKADPSIDKLDDYTVTAKSITKILQLPFRMFRQD